MDHLARLHLDRRSFVAAGLGAIGAAATARL
jgi:hypothetical protein